MASKIELFGYQLGFYIQEEGKSRDYEMNGKEQTFTNCSVEDWDMWRDEIKSIIEDINTKTLKLKSDIDKVHALELETVNIDNLVIQGYKHLADLVYIHIPHLIYYYLKHDQEELVTLLTNLKSLYNVIPKVPGSGCLITYSFDGIKAVNGDVLKLDAALNFVDQTTERLEKYNDYFQLDSFDVSKIKDIYKD